MNDNLSEQERQELAYLRRQRILEQICAADRDVIEPRDTAILLDHQLRSGDIDVAAAKEGLDWLRRTSPWMFRSGRADGGHLTGVAPMPRQRDEDLAAALFGVGNGAAACRLAKENRTEYRRLRQVAEKIGVI